MTEEQKLNLQKQKAAIEKEIYGADIEQAQWVKTELDNIKRSFNVSYI